MAEEKKESIFLAPVREFDNQKSVIYRVTNPLNKLEKFEIVWPVPETDEECQERYNCPLKDLIVQGVRNLATRPDYIQSGFVCNKDGKPEELKADGHEQMQGLADVYQTGRKATVGESVKAKAQKADKIEAELAKAGGLSFEELMEKARAAGIVG